MTVYILLFFSVAIISIVNYTNKRNYMRVVNWMLIIFLLLLSGTRYNLGGSDYYEYSFVFQNTPKLYDFFTNYSNLYIIYNVYSFEKGYLLLSSIVKTLGISFNGFTLIISILFYFLFFRGLNNIKKDNFTFSFIILIFIFKLFFYNTFISMRQSISIAVFTYSWSFLEDRNFKKYLLCSIIAISMHSTAFFMLPLYFLWNINFSSKKIVFLNLVFILASMIGYYAGMQNFSFDFIKFFMRSEVDLLRLNKLLYGTKTSLNPIHIIEYFFLMILLICNFDNLKYRGSNPLYVKLFIYMLPIFTIFSYSNMITRMKDYFIISFAFLLSDIFSIDKKNRFIFFLGLIFYGGVIFFRFIVSFDNGSLMPYRSYIFE